MIAFAPQRFLVSLGSIALIFVATPSHAERELSPEAQTRTAELVKDHRDSLVFVSGSNGVGSGFLANWGDATFLVTNAHIAAGVKTAAFKNLEGTKVPVGAASVAVGHDIFLMHSTIAGKPFAIMKSVEENAAIGDEVVVLGNAGGAGVINTLIGRIVGLGPNLVEIDSPFEPGNSGSPIIHLKTGSVIGVATYLMIRKYDLATNEPIKEPVVRRFGYRLDSVKTWQPVQWAGFFAQAAQMENVEKLTEDLRAFLEDLARDARVTPGRHTNPVIKNRIDAWVEAKRRQMSAKDSAALDQNFVSFLKITCRTDVAAVAPRLTYDYFQRTLTEQQRERSAIAEIFDQIIKQLQKGR